MSPPATVQTTVDLSGSSGGTCQLYSLTPTTTAGSTSYAYGRRITSGSTNSVKESVTRYPGTHTFGQLCSATSGTPPGWLGYYVRYDAGASSTCAIAEAGTQTGDPSYCTAGTISVYNGSGYSSFAPPAPGGAWGVATGTTAPATLSWTSTNSWRYDMTASLSTSPSYTTETPTGATGTADRTSSRAVSGSPVAGTITYKVTNPSSAVVVDLTLTIDLGTLTAYARYAP